MVNHRSNRKRFIERSLGPGAMKPNFRTFDDRRSISLDLTATMLMTKDESMGLALDVAGSPIGAIGDCRWSTAAALAETSHGGPLPFLARLSLAEYFIGRGRR